MDAVDPNAYDAFKASRNLGDVIERVLKNQQEASNGSGPKKLLTIEASLMTPVQPMLVRIPSKSVKLYSTDAHTHSVCLLFISESSCECKAEVFEPQ